MLGIDDCPHIGLAITKGFEQPRFAIVWHVVLLEDWGGYRHKPVLTKFRRTQNVNEAVWQFPVQTGHLYFFYGWRCQRTGQHTRHGGDCED
jgi:hypothetical protein